MTPLTPEQQQIASSRRLGVNRPVDEVLNLIRVLVEFDKTTESKRKKAGWSIPLAIVAMIAFLILSNAGGAMRAAGLVGALLSLAATIGAIVLYRRFKAEDLSGNLESAAAPFLAILREDMKTGEPLHVNIDLRPYSIDEKKKKESEPRKQGAYYMIIDSLFVDPWFDGNALLADGTKVQWNVTEHVLQTIKSKKNPRGKTKTKTKVKRKTVAVVKLSFANREYAVSGDDAASGEKRTTLTLARKLKTRADESPALSLLVDLIADGYRRVSVPRSA